MSLPCSIGSCTRPAKLPSCFCDKHAVYIEKPRKPRAKTELEQPIKMRIRDALIAEGCMVKVHNVDNRQMATGLGLGVSDLICIVPPHGRFLAIEVKRPKVGVVSDAQEAFIKAVRKFGGIAGEARSVEDALALLAEARQSATIAALDPATIG